jgi:MFS family permease
MRWYDFLAINAYWFGNSNAAGTLTPILLPYLILLFMPPEEKNSALATLRVIGLAVAMLIQPLAGTLSDRSTSRFGRRRPFIFLGAVLNVLFLLIIGASTLLRGAPGTLFGWPLAYAVLILGTILIQFSANIAQGALQALIPDLVPEHQRGRASGYKSILDLLPSLTIILIGPLVDKGLVWIVIAITAFGYLSTMLITVLSTHEEPLREKPASSMNESVWRLAALTAIFVGISQGAVWLVKTSGAYLASQGVALGTQVAAIGTAGLVAMAGSIFLGVYLGAWVGIGKEASNQRGFIWWVINRLLFLAAVGSIQGFAQFYLKDVVKVENPASMTTLLLAAVALFLLPSALAGGYLADRLGRKRLVGASGLVAALGTLVLLVAGPSIPLILVSGAIIGLATGTFMATNWALGTDLAPKQDAGKYLGISNLAGAGAGIVGAGIGGPMADFFNRLSPGLGYLVIFAIYGVLFLISVLVLRQVK